MKRNEPYEKFKTSLNEFVELAREGTACLMECPRCENQFTVDGKIWRELTTKLGTKPCPYCFKVSLVPLDFYPTQVGATLAALRG